MELTHQLASQRAPNFCIAFEINSLLAARQRPIYLQKALPFDLRSCHSYLHG